MRTSIRLRHIAGRLQGLRLPENKCRRLCKRDSANPAGFLEGPQGLSILPFPGTTPHRSRGAPPLTAV
eukprot:10349336-Heterocapsa_arctica.AAC.1